LPWTVERLVQYLRKGWTTCMAPQQGRWFQWCTIFRRLPSGCEGDAYIASLDTRRSSAKKTRRNRRARASAASTAEPGAQVYAGACALCHGAGSASTERCSIAQLRARCPPANLIHIIQEGILPREGSADLGCRLRARSATRNWSSSQLPARAFHRCALETCGR
jgi:hypothetical protein